MLSQKMCSNIHIGSKNKECPALKVDGQNMKNSKLEAYLGDIIDNNTKAKANIEKRKARGCK